MNPVSKVNNPSVSIRFSTEHSRNSLSKALANLNIKSTIQGESGSEETRTLSFTLREHHIELTKTNNQGSGFLCGSDNATYNIKIDGKGIAVDSSAALNPLIPAVQNFLKEPNHKNLLKLNFQLSSMPTSAKTPEPSQRVEEEAQLRRQLNIENLSQKRSPTPTKQETGATLQKSAVQTTEPPPQPPVVQKTVAPPQTTTEEIMAPIPQPTPKQVTDSASQRPAEKAIETTPLASPSAGNTGNIQQCTLVDTKCDQTNEIGKGSFGQVYKMKASSNEQEIEIALKRPFGALTDTEKAEIKRGMGFQAIAAKKGLAPRVYQASNAEPNDILMELMPTPDMGKTLKMGTAKLK